MKKIFILFLIPILLFSYVSRVDAKETIIETHMESVIMVDVARRYYTVDELKKYIDALSKNDNSTLQLHFTDDENVGIECTYLDQTVENATYENGIYTNPNTGKRFLSYEQVQELMDYAKSKNVNFVPEIDVPAHMKGFFTLAKLKFGEEYVRNGYDWDNPENSGIAWGRGDEEGNLDLMSPNGKPFVQALLDEYTEFFKECKYFHIGFDEYTFRPEMKIEYANELYTYLSNKGFKVRMWSDAITKDNIDDLNNNIEITYWGWKDDDVLQTNYATVPDLQEKGFKILITNKYYLFYVPNPDYNTPEGLARSISNIENDWELEEWNYNFTGGLSNHQNILGGMVCNWGENSTGVDDNTITTHTINMYNAMFPKLDVYRKVVKSEEEDNTFPNPDTNDNIKSISVLFGISLLTLILLKIHYEKINNII